MVLQYCCRRRASRGEPGGADGAESEESAGGILCRGPAGFVGLMGELGSSSVGNGSEPHDLVQAVFSALRKLKSSATRVNDMPNGSASS